MSQRTLDGNLSSCHSFSFQSISASDIRFWGTTRHIRICNWSSRKGIITRQTFHIIERTSRYYRYASTLPRRPNVPNASLAMTYYKQQLPVSLHDQPFHQKFSLDSVILHISSPHSIHVRRAVTAQAVLFTTNTPTSIPSLAASDSAYGLSFTPSHTSRTKSEAVTSSISPEAFILFGNMSPLLKYALTTFVILSLS